MTSRPTGATTVALVHGVGFGPSTFAAVAGELRRAGLRVLVFERRGYGTRAGVAPAPDVEDHVADLVAALDAAGIDRAVVAGASGGATVALAAALSARDRVVAAVAHEPAVGSLAPELLALIARSLRAADGMALLRALAGPATWSRLTDGEAAQLEAGAGVVEADARAYLAWEPALDAAPSGAPIITTVGERSGELRHIVARRLAERAGARVVLLPGCGHLAQLDAPAAFAAVIADVARAGRTRPRRTQPVSVAGTTMDAPTYEER